MYLINVYTRRIAINVDKYKFRLNGYRITMIIITLRNDTWLLLQTAFPKPFR